MEKELLKNKFSDEIIDPTINITVEIQRLKQEKKAILLAHYYQRAEVQAIADFVGDSLQLSEQAAATDAEVIVFAGVHFMAETAKILSPQKKVLLPDRQAGCSLADSCPVADFKAFIARHPNHTVIAYVNTSAGIKAVTDICCTSSNALKIVNALPKDQPIIFAPDRNLGNYIKTITGRENMLVWNGACHVHEAFSVEKLVALKKQYPDAKVLAHPECKKALLLLADCVGSTAALLQYSQSDAGRQYIVVTEPGIIFQMQKASPDKTFIPLPGAGASGIADDCGACNECAYMKQTTPAKIYRALKHGQPEVLVDETIRRQAEKSIRRMLELSK